MAITTLDLIPQSSFASNYGRHPMAIHTSTQKVTSDDRPYYMYHENGMLSQQRTDPFTRISIKITLRLLLDYVKAMDKIGIQDHSLSNKIFTKIIHTLLAYGISTENISVTSTDDDSILVRGKSSNKGFYFETYFDSDEYEDGYEIIANVYQDNHCIASIAGSTGFILSKLDSKISARLVA